MLRLHAPPHLTEEANALAEKNTHLSGSLFATSGTSGKPQWILHSQQGLDWCAHTVNEHFGCTSQDVWGLALPKFHVGGHCLTHRAQLARGRLATFPNKWDAHLFHQWLTVEKVTLTSLVPTQIFDLVTSKKKAPPTLRLALIGGEHLESTLFEKALALGWPLVVSYGMTETAGLIAASTIGEKDLQPLPGWELGTNDKGLLTIAGPGIFQGHLTNEGLQTTTPPFTTKDLVELSDSTLKVLGRSDDQIKILGELIDLTQLRKSLATALPHHRTTVLALPDTRRNYRLQPIIEGTPIDDLQTSVSLWNKGLAPFSRCQAPIFINKWPRTPLGKLDYRTLTEQVTNEQDYLLPDIQPPA